MKLQEIEIFIAKTKESNLDLPNDIIFLCSDFEKEVPKNMHSHILINYENVSIMSEAVYNTFIKKNAKL